MQKHMKQGLSLLLCVLLIGNTLFMGSTAKAAAAGETVSFPVVQDAFVSNFGTQGDSLGIALNANKLIYGKFRHTYLKFDLSSIDTEKYNVDEMQVILSFRKTHAANELVFTESEPTLRSSGLAWTVNNLTYNTRPNDIAGSPVVTQNVTSNGEQNLSVDLSTIFRSALNNGRKVVSIHLTTTKVDDSAVSASEMYSSRNTSGQPGPFLAVTLGNPIVDDAIDRTALNALIAEADQLMEADYTAASWAVFAEALNNAQEASAGSATQDEVNQALLLLQTAMNNLKDAELPSKITGPNMGNYFNNSKSASMIFKMKNGDGKYVKVDPVTEKLSLTANAAEASAFALYVLDYFATVDKEEPEVGATRTAYSIKSLDNGKYLTIQNYFTAEEFLNNEHRYFNILSGAQSGTSTERTFEVKASASIPNWNERFYVDRYVESGYYRIWSHLSTMRDDAGFNRFNVTMTDDSMQSTGTAAQNIEYRFYFEEVTGRDQLEVSQKVSGDDADLFWRPVNGDTDPASYRVVGTDAANVVFADGLMHVTLSDLSAGDHGYTVEYNGNGYQATTDVKVRIFSHPGILLAAEDLNRMKLRVQEEAEPWYSDYQRLLNSVSYNLSSFDYETTVFSNVGRGGAPSDSANIGYFEKGGNAAYFNALQWVITGDNKYADKAVDILGKWAKALKVIDGRDRILGAGINAYKYASAAEIIRYYNGGYSGYSDADFKALQDMMINVVYPVIQDAAAPMLANGNWDVAAIVSMMSIGVLCDNSEIFDRATAFYQDIHVNGSIFAYVNDSGQTMETGRDQAHAMLGIGYMAEICLIAYNQDVDLYSLYDNRLAKAFEYSAKYNLYSKELYGEDVPFVAMPNVFGDTSRGYYGAGFDRENNGLNRGELRPVFEQALALYTKAGGVDMTWTTRAAAGSRPQAMVHFDNLNFGTLTYYNGEPLHASGPYFQMRTRWEPLYQRNWSIVDGQRVAETLNSYYNINENGELVTSVMKMDAPFYQMVANDDGTFSIRLVKSNTYLSVKDDTVNGLNIIKADATAIGENEKFILRSSGVGPFFLVSPKYDNRIVYQYAAGSGSSAVLTLRLGTKKLSQIADIPDISTNERLIFMYNFEDVALNGSAAPSITSAGSSSVASGEGGTFQVEATGTTPLSYRLDGAPDSVTINGRTGLITIADTLTVGIYSFTIMASNGILPNATLTFTLTVEAIVPGTPMNVTATPGDGLVTLNWNAPASDGGAEIIMYEVSQDNGATWIDADTDTTHTFNGLTNGTAYTFTVRAVNSAGSGAVAEAKATPVAVPAVPSKVSAKKAGPAAIEVSWTAVSGATGYNVYRSLKGESNYVKINQEWITTNSFTDPDLSAGTKYYYKVTAVNQSGESAMSKETHAKTEKK
ncbi:fibronectin type III domain-containing protein [Paenibacillus arenilitoris]|uniref:Fibronectin type III domain-containing protein n=1 Tax=Paenibacillus arenilitoris TaxID=2772299 RepID=A0A927CM55_9BACL|nr:fibronectin type III domain-containing protein [Paenibacillus arenilitoris]MBD2869123.1 fibronectin type III domain-containing protein [Paenibacillus arenilitoris]